MNDVNKLAQQLINALRDSTSSQVDLLGLNRRNFFEDGMNRAASRGTLYSGGNQAQQTRYEGSTYLPAVTQARSQGLQQEIGIKSDVLETKRKIEAQKRAAKEINSITYTHLLPSLE